METDLIQKIVSEVINRMKTAEETKPAKPNSKNALVIFSGGTTGLAETLSQLQAIAASSYRLQVVMTPAAEDVISESLIKSKLGDVEIISEVNRKSPGELTKNADKIIVPVLTMNTAAKLAYGIADNLASTVVLYGLLRGKPVIAVRDACDPCNPIRDKIGMNSENETFRSMLLGNLLRLEQYGIVLVNSGDLSAAVMGLSIEKKCSPMGSVKPERVFSQKVLSAGDIALCREKFIKVSDKTVITAMAMDLAKERGIEILM